MGTIPIVENVRIDWTNGHTIRISVNSTTSDLSMCDEGLVWVAGEMDGGHKFGFDMPLGIFSEVWFRRLCDSMSADHEFCKSLLGIGSIDASFVIPQPPNKWSDETQRVVSLGGNATIRDFADLRSGRDKFSAMKLPQLATLIGDLDVAEARRKLAGIAEKHRDTELTKALRWVLRGLPLHMAIRKVEVDRDISLNPSLRHV